MKLTLFISLIIILFGVYFYVNNQYQKTSTLGTSTHIINKFFFANSHLYKIPSTSKYILIDSLVPGSENTILTKIKELGIKEEDIALIYHTHYHDDHVGSTIALSKTLNSKIWIHPKDQELMDKEIMPGVPRSSIQVFDYLMKNRTPKKLQNIKTNIDLKLNEKLKELGDVKIRLTPGHTEFHTSLITPTGDCFIGDLLKGAFFNINQPSLSWFYERSLEEIEDSARKLLEEEKSCKIFWVGHGLPFSRESLEQYFKEKQ